jgi:hypothetical protein
MVRKFLLGVLTCGLMLSMALVTPVDNTMYAQGSSPTSTPDPNDFTVTLEMTGVIASITPQADRMFLIAIQDGMLFLVTPETQGNATLAVGQNVTITAVIDGKAESGPLVARIINAAVVAGTLTPTLPPPTIIAIQPTSVVTLLPVTPVGTIETPCDANQRQPMAMRLADAFGVSYQEINGWHCRGFGFGEIAKAYLLDELGEFTVEDVFDLRLSGVGWGEIMKQANVNPSELAPGQVIKIDNDHGKHPKEKKPKKPHNKNNKGKK